MPPSPRCSRLLQLEQLADLRSGFAPRRLVADPFGQYRGLQARDLGSAGGIQWSRLMTPRIDTDPARHQVRDGDLVVSLRGASVRAWRIVNPPERTVVVGQLVILSARAGLADPGYLLWYLNHPDTAARFQLLAKGSSLSFVPTTEFRRFLVALPPHAVQQRIGRTNALAESEHKLVREIAALRRHMTDAQLLRVAETR